jgi:hypothetical protein
MSTLKTGNITHPSSTGTAITLDASDNVGIGQGTPTATLDVNGTIKLDGNYPVGTNNVALGDTALDSVSSGQRNVAIGTNALTSVTSGQRNTAVGYIALTNNTGSYNSAFGEQALQATTSGQYNTASGSSAAANNTTGSYNTAVGQSALLSNTTADSNTAVGKSALTANTTGTQNTTVGKDSLGSNTTGNYNTTLGSNALVSNTTANNNTAVGYQAGYTNSTGINHTLIGKDAGYSTTGSSNTFVGVDSGYYVSSGGSNTVLGRYNGNQGGLDIRTSSSNIVLSDGAGNPRTHINSTGHHFISPDLSTMGNSGNKHVTANTATGNYIQIFEHSAASSNVYGVFVNFYAGAPNDTVRTFLACQDSSTSRMLVYSNGNLVNRNNSYGALSDEKLKENIVDSGSQWNDIKALRVRKYSMKEDALDAPNRLGVIAQEVEAAGMGGLVFESPDTDADLNDLGTVTKQVNYSVLYMKAVKALQEAMERIETLEAKVAALETP